MIVKKSVLTLTEFWTVRKGFQHGQWCIAYARDIDCLGHVAGFLAIQEYFQTSHGCEPVVTAVWFAAAVLRDCPHF